LPAAVLARVPSSDSVSKAMLFTSYSLGFTVSVSNSGLGEVAAFRGETAQGHFQFRTTFTTHVSRQAAAGQPATTSKDCFR
jgi:hypothetical protein